MRDLAGVASLAAAALWIAYLVPHLLRHRQQLLESCIEDRFSGALRVLAVADRSGRALRAGEARSGRSPGGEKHAGLLTPCRGIPVQGHIVAGGGVGIVDRPRGMQDRISTDAARRAAGQRARRAATLARRGAAARRRAVLSVALFTMSAVAWIVVGMTTLAIVAAVVPTVVLASVLVLGRRAVVQGHRADVAWEHRRRVSRAGVRPTSGPVIGRAYHASDTPTQAIACVSAAVLAQAASHDASALSGVVSDAEASPETPAESHAWSPVPVPPPIYTTKAAAPRREPIPLVIDDPSPATPGASDGRLTPDVDPGVTHEPAATTASLDLDAILARRRTAG